LEFDVLDGAMEPDHGLAAAFNTNHKVVVWARALNLASILEVKMVVALATLHPLPPSELAALALVASEATTDSNGKTTMII